MRSEVDASRSEPPEGGKALLRRRLFAAQRSGAGTTSASDEEEGTLSGLAETYADTATRLAARTHMADVAAPPAWQFLGPTSIPDGQTYEPGYRVHVSGRIGAIAVDPSNSAHLLAGAAGGGIWESADGGAT